MASAAIAYSSKVFDESSTIGEIASRRSARAEPAYASERPIRAPILWSYFGLSSFSKRIANTGSVSFLIPLFTKPMAM